MNQENDTKTCPSCVSNGLYEALMIHTDLMWYCLTCSYQEPYERTTS